MVKVGCVGVTYQQGKQNKYYLLFTYKMNICTHKYVNLIGHLLFMKYYTTEFQWSLLKKKIVVIIVHAWMRGPNFDYLLE